MRSSTYKRRRQGRLGANLLTTTGACRPSNTPFLATCAPSQSNAAPLPNLQSLHSQAPLALAPVPAFVCACCLAKASAPSSPVVCLQPQRLCPIPSIPSRAGEPPKRTSIRLSAWQVSVGSNRALLGRLLHSCNRSPGKVAGAECAHEGSECVPAVMPWITRCQHCVASICMPCRNRRALHAACCGKASSA